MEDMHALKSAYDEWHKSLYHHEADGYVLSKVWYRKTAEALPDLNGLRVLEVGCGRGEFSNYLHVTYPGATIVATDFSESAIEIARKRFPHDATLTFQVEDVQQLSFRSEEFDFVICCETLEHVPDVEKAVGEICRVLRKEGRFIITTPSYFNAYSLVWLKSWLSGKPYASGQGVQPFEHYYTFLYVSRVIRKSGLRLQRTLSTNFQWLVWPRTDPAKLRTVEFQNPIWNQLFKPFGVHFFYFGSR